FASLACGGLLFASPGRKVCVAASYSNTAQPQPPLSAKRLLSLTMKSTFFWAPATVGVPGAVRFFFGSQWILAILAPSGNGLPLAGMPALNASIIVGFPRITDTAGPFSLMLITCQLS